MFGVLANSSMVVQFFSLMFIYSLRYVNSGIQKGDQLGVDVNINN